MNVLTGKFCSPVYGFGRAIARWNRLGVKITKSWELFARPQCAKMCFLQHKLAPNGRFETWTVKKTKSCRVYQFFFKYHLTRARLVPAVRENMFRSQNKIKNGCAYTDLGCKPKFILSSRAGGERSEPFREYRY